MTTVVTFTSLDKAGAYAQAVRAGLRYPRRGLNIGSLVHLNLLNSEYSRVYKNGLGAWAYLYDSTVQGLNIPLPAGSAVQNISLASYSIDPDGDPYLAVYDGNSLTAGSGASPFGFEYPAVSNAQLAQKGYLVQGPNLGIGGQTTAQMLAGAPANVDPLFKVWRSLNVVIGWEITNSLYFGALPDPTYADYATYCLDRRAVGYRVIAINCLPRNQVGQPALLDQYRREINFSIEKFWRNYADRFIDIASVPQLMNTANPTYYQLDQVHLTDAGYAVVAATVRPVIESLFQETAF